MTTEAISKPCQIRVSVLALLAAGSVFAALPQVSNVSVDSSAPKRVTVSYVLANAPAIVTVDFRTNGVSIGEANFTTLSGDVNKKVTGNGRHSLTWNARADWPDRRVPAFSAVVTAWPLANPPDYMVASLSVESNVCYYVSTNALPGGLADPVYATTNLVMRRVHARGIPWQQGGLRDPGQRLATGYGQTVVLDADYYIGIYPVTQRQFMMVTGGSRRGNFYTNPDRRPVENVSYNEVYCNAVGTHTNPSEDTYMYPNPPNPDSWLGRLRKFTGFDFDLPSELQWEYAARSGTYDGYWNDGTPSYTASDASCPGRVESSGRIWNSDTSKYEDPANDVAPENRGTAIVGSYNPSKWGIYDMHGNVCEFCHDFAGSGISKHRGKVNANGLYDLDGTARTSRMRRGGCWYWPASTHACAYTRADEIDCSQRAKYNGFRVICPIAR